MAECLCQCQTFSPVGATPGTTYNFTYNDCNTGVPTTIFVDNDTEPFIRYCYTTGNPGISINLLSGAFTGTSFSNNQNGFKVIDCSDANNFFYTITDLSSYSNTPQTLEFDEFTGCWYVVPDVICDFYVLVTVATVHTSCEACVNPPPTTLSLDFISCCGIRVYFKIPASDAGFYGNVGDTYVYNGPPIADAFGVIMYPNQCYWISVKEGVDSLVRPLAPLPNLFGPLIGVNPTSCTSDVCSHCFYKLQDCTNPANILISYSNLAAYLGQTITVENHPGCWIVSETSLTEPAPIAVVPIQGYASCIACSPNIKLTPCCGTRPPVIISNSIISLVNVGKVVCIENIDPVVGCWTIGTSTDPVNYTGTVTVGEYSASCQDCVDLGCKTCQPCYLLTPCDTGTIDPIVVNNDLSSFVGNVMELCPSNLPTVILPDPASGNPVSGTFLPGALYDLVDCCSLLPTITVNLNIGVYAGQILNIPTLSPTTCWLVRKSTLNIQPYVTLNLTGATAYTSCEICTRGQLTCSQNIPQLTECACFDVTVAPSCTSSITLTSIGTAYADCETCIGYCYILTDCEGILPNIETEDDLSTYVGDVIKIETCPDTCWQVQQSTRCPNPVTLPTITNTYSKCEDCLPPILPLPPVELITRRVKPGYYTKGCPPEYTEKISCKFGDTMFDDVAKIRYGINICCDHDVEKWWIKKELLNLKAIYDPALDVPVKSCYCYTIVQTAGSTDFKYINCEGICATVTLAEGDTKYVCSQTWPNAICPESGALYNIEASTTSCTDDQSCQPICYCYTLYGENTDFVIDYTKCNGTIVRETYQGTVYICAQENTLTLVSGSVKGITQNGLCTESIQCLPCNCYIIKGFANVSINAIDCNGSSISVPVSTDRGFYICLQDIPTSTRGVEVIQLDVTDCGTECYSDCRCLNISALGDLTFSYLNCNNDVISVAMGQGDVINICGKQNSITQDALSLLDITDVGDCPCTF